MQKNHEKLLKLIETVYQYLPLGTIVNNEVLIVHGGISDITDLEKIKCIDRRKVSYNIKNVFLGEFITFFLVYFFIETTIE